MATKISDMTLSSGGIASDTQFEVAQPAGLGWGTFRITGTQLAAFVSTSSPVTSVAGRTGVVTLTKSDVGLSNVDNTSDATKNSATVTLTNKTLTSPVITTPTGIVKGDVGLGNVDNTSDVNKPVSTAQAAANALKLSLTGGTMTGQTVEPNGSASAPTLAFNSNSGMYWETSPIRVGENALGIAIDGNANLQLSHVSATDATRLIVASNNLAGFTAQTFGSTGASNSFINASGTRASPGISTTGATLGGLNYSAYLSTTGPTLLGQITTTLIEPTPSATAGGLRVIVSLAPLGAVARTETIRIEAASGLSMYGANVVIDSNRSHRKVIKTVGTLPSASPAGQTYHVTDALTPVKGSTVASGGAVFTGVTSDGTNWKVD